MTQHTDRNWFPTAADPLFAEAERLQSEGLDIDPTLGGILRDVMFEAFDLAKGPIGLIGAVLIGLAVFA